MKLLLLLLPLLVLASADLPGPCMDHWELDSYTRNQYTPGYPWLCGSTWCCDKLNTGNTVTAKGLNGNSKRALRQNIIPIPGYSYTRPDWHGDGWYRFTGQAGTKMMETPPGWRNCGTDITGYLTGGHPQPEDGEVTRTVYFDYGSNHLDEPTEVRVINCGGDYYVYYLVDVPCWRSYCAQ